MTPPRRPTVPEGIPTTKSWPPDFATPTPIAMPEAAPAWSGWRPVIVVVSTIVGIVVGVGGILGGLGKAFYVEREEYTAKIIRDAVELSATRNNLKQVEESLARQEALIAKMTADLQAAREAQSLRRR